MADRSKLFIAIGLLVVVVGVALYFLVIRPRGAAPEAPAVAQAPAGPAQPAPAAAPPAERRAAPAREEGEEEAEEAKPEAAAPELKGSQEPYRPDPFAQFQIPKGYEPPPPPLVTVFAPYPTVDLSRITAGVAPLHEEPPRRVAGLLWDSRVWALVEIRGRVSVVKPGDIVEDGTVQAITDEGLLLRVPDREELVLVPLERGVARPSTLGPTPAGVTRPGVMPGPTPAGMGPGAAYPMAPGMSPMVPAL